MSTKMTTQCYAMQYVQIRHPLYDNNINAQIYMPNYLSLLSHPLSAFPPSLLPCTPRSESRARAYKAAIRTVLRQFLTLRSISVTSSLMRLPRLCKTIRRLLIAARGGLLTTLLIAKRRNSPTEFSCLDDTASYWRRHCDGSSALRGCRDWGGGYRCSCRGT